MTAPLIWPAPSGLRPACEEEPPDVDMDPDADEPEPDVWDEYQPTLAGDPWAVA